MKALKSLLLVASLFSWIPANGSEGLVTVVTAGAGSKTNHLEIASDQNITHVFSYAEGSGSGSGISVIKDGVSFTFPRGVPVVGPARIEMFVQNNEPPGIQMISTFEIKPASYPVDKAAVVGPHSGPVKVTMEMSTDLVNWTVPANGGIYTNSPDARFFRIKLDKEVTTP